MEEAGSLVCPPPTPATVVVNRLLVVKLRRTEEELRDPEFLTSHTGELPSERLFFKEQNVMTRSFRSLLGKVALLFAVVFSVLAGGQYWFVSHQLHRTTQRQLLRAAEGIRADIAFQSAWDLLGYRRVSSEAGADIYAVLAATGTVIDVIGYAPGFLQNVSFPFSFKYDEPFRAKSDVGENWVFYVRKLKDGMAILGARGDGLPEDLEQRIRINAERFGNSVAQAIQVQERSIDGLFDYAVVDERGMLRQSLTAIPLKTSSPQIPGKPTFIPLRPINGGVYAILEDPIADKNGRTVGVIRVFRDVTDEQRVLREAGIFNIGIAAVIWLATISIAAAYLNHLRGTEISCAQIPLLDESDKVEFKSSLRWDYKNQVASREVERAVIKTVAGFLNCDHSGTLVIGVNDQKQILGLDADYSTFKSVKRDRDGFEQTLRQILVNAVGEIIYAKCVKVTFCKLSDKELCLVRVAAAREPVFVHTEGVPTMYVRMGNATRPLNAKDAVSYSSTRWATPLLSWPLHRREPAPLRPI